MLRYQGKRWWMWRSPVPFRTGEKSGPEKVVRVLALAGTPAIGVLAYVPMGL